MSIKRLIFVSFWQDTLKEIIDFLREKEYQDIAMIKHMEELLEGKEK